MPFTAAYLQVSFGSTRTGIATVGYTLMKDDGTVSVARATAGVVEEGGGVYGVAGVTIPDNAFSVLWDTGGGSPVYAAEDLEPMRLRETVEGLAVANLDATVSSRATPAQVKTQADQALVDYDPPTHAEMTSEHGVLSGEHSSLSTEHGSILTAIGLLNNLSIADVQTALDNQGYTSVRAALLDNLDAAISTVLTAIGALNDPSVAEIDTQLSGTHGAGSWATATGFATPGDAMTLTAGERDAIRAEIMTYVVNSNILGLTFEQSLDLMRKVLNNRLELADGDTGNWLLYDDDDGPTPLLTYNVTNKNAGPIDLPTAAPAQRTRGV